MVARFILTFTDSILGIIEFFIGARILLKLLGASTQAAFVRWVYETTDPLLQPFLGMFPSPKLSSGFVLEVSSLFALIVYAFAGLLLESAIERLSSFSSQRK